MSALLWIALGVVVMLAVLAARDLTQRKHAIRRNFPLAGRLRYLLEKFGPELRQYIVTSNNEERPFSRDQRSWVYASSKAERNTVGFGTDDDPEGHGEFLIVKHAAFPVAEPPQVDLERRLPAGKVLGGARARQHAFRPASLVNISGMSFGALSAPAVQAMNQGAALSGALHNTGEGGLAEHHLHGGDLIFQIGTGYFGCRDLDGRFDVDQLKATISRGPVRALEIKLSQGAKPTLGGHVPAAKVTEEIARIRGVRPGVDCISPGSHSAFSCADELLDFVEMLAAETGLPVGIKSAVGQLTFWEELASLMSRGDRGVDFITVDGGEGGTGAAPLTFTDHVSLPFKLGFTRAYRTFWEAGVAEDVTWIGSAKLGFPEAALTACAMGADMINVGREAMLAVGCIQAQKCHTGHCPTGVATQSKWLMRGLDPTLKAARCANYIRVLRGELLALSRAVGAEHPGLVGLEQLEILSDGFRARTADAVFDYPPGCGQPSPERAGELRALMRALTGGERSDATV